MSEGMHVHEGTGGSVSGCGLCIGAARLSFDWSD